MRNTSTAWTMIICSVLLLVSCSKTELEAAKRSTSTVAGTTQPTSDRYTEVAPQQAASPEVPPPASTTSVEPTPAVPQVVRPWRSDFYRVGNVKPGATEEEAAVAEAYLAYREAFLEAEMGPEINVDHPGLAAYAVDPILTGVRELLQGFRDDGVVARLAEDSLYEIDVTVMSIDGDRAQLIAFTVNDAVLYKASSGEIVDDRVVSRTISVELRRIDGQWHVANQTVLDLSERMDE